MSGAAFCDRCGGEFMAAALVDGLCARCRGHLRARDAREAAKWYVCGACGRRAPRLGNRPARLCPECREKEHNDAERRRLEKVRAKEGAEWVQRPKR